MGGIQMHPEFRYQYNGMTAEAVALSLGKTVAKVLRTRYGPTPDPAIIKRVREEWTAMEASGDIEDVAALYELTLWLKERREPYWMRGTPGASLILYLLGITTGNPLPPHYYCPQCHRVIWVPSYVDGFDLPPDRICEKDGSLLRGDGHNIPWQTHWGYGKEMSYEFNVTEPLLEVLTAFFQGHWLAKLRPGMEFTRRHMDPDADPRFMKFSRFSINCLLDPSEVSPDFYDIVPDASCISNAAKTLRSHLDTMDDVDANLRSRPVHTFADIIAKYGLVHSTGVWDKDAHFMVKRLGYSLADLIAYRDDVFSYLLSHGFLEKDALDGMDRVRLGRGLPIVTSEMSLARDKWVIDRCKRVKYLYPKAHAVEHVLYRLRAEGLRSMFITSYEVLLDAFGGGHGANVVLLGGRPAMGKSTFAVYLAKRLSQISGMTVAVFVQDDGDKRVYKRNLSEETEETASQGKVMVYEETGGGIDVIRERLKAAPADFVVLDLLKNIAGNCIPGDGTEEKVAFMSGIRALADEMNIPVLVTSGLNRETDRRKEHKPRIEDIFQSADIVRYADTVMLLYRESYYDPAANQNNAMCIIAKHPCGVLKEISLLWDDERATWEDVVYSSAEMVERY